ncbi:class I adenylate-forming enzyme family protein [Sphingomonas aestuarii]
MTADDPALPAALIDSDFGTLSDLIAAHARAQPDKAALVGEDAMLDYAALDGAMDRIAATLQAASIARGTPIAMVASNSAALATLFLGALRAGCVPTPLAPSSTPDQIAAMVADCGSPMLFAEDASLAALADAPFAVPLLALGELDRWANATTPPAAVEIAPEDPFNIIYSSGTTGTPKGIVQPHAMRWAQVSRSNFTGAVTMIATPLYSNTTLVSFLPTLAWGGTAVLMKKFDARRFLELAQANRATHAMLVPVQYARIMALPDFDAFDLSSFVLKTCTSAPFSAALKADIVARWPGLLVEYYGMTEGGGTTLLVCNQFPDKLATVGRPIEGHDIRLIDDDGVEVAPGEVGEVVGRSPAMMSGYFGRKEASSAAEWFDADGNRFIRHGDVGRFDADGFLTLLDRKKDLIISGGFNIYPSDLEAILATHPDVVECTVVGMPSEAWGETPMGFYVARADAEDEAAAILGWFNERVGKTQRLSELKRLDELPRSAIGKVLKRDLRDRYQGADA